MRYFYGGVLVLLVAGCDLFEYHPYEVRIPDSETNLNAKAIARLQQTTPATDTLTLILMGDTQRFYDEVEDFVSSANKQKADFVMLDGDITDFGIRDEFEWIHDIMSKLNKPYMTVIGNHDLSGNGEKVYKKMYGSLNDSFLYRDFKFILLNTNSREYAFNGKVPDLDWLQTQLAGDDFQRAVVISHVPPFDDDFDIKLAARYNEMLYTSGKVNLSLHGHQHAFRDTTYNEGHIRYLVSTSMNERMYLLIKLWDDQVDFKKIFY
jgi:3',5'-cyclic AMP phosphodiesterase CpdA